MGGFKNNIKIKLQVLPDSNIAELRLTFVLMRNGGSIVDQPVLDRILLKSTKSDSQLEGDAKSGPDF